MSEPESYLTVAEVAEILKLNQRTVHNWIDAGKLPALRIGRRVRIKRSDFDRLLDQAYTETQPLTSSEATAAGFWDGEEIPTPAE